MPSRNTPTHIDSPDDIACSVTGHTIGLGTHKHGCAMHLSPAAARWLAKELQMQAAEVDRKAAEDMVSNVRMVME